MMHTEKVKAKNTVVASNDRLVDATLTPNQSVGVFKLDDNITHYLHLDHILKQYEEGMYSYDEYEFLDSKLIVWVQEGRIDSICCKDVCYWKDHNLIKMLFDDFLTLSGAPPDKSEIIYTVVYGRGQNQTVYEFDDLGLQIWVWRKKIVTVIASNLQDLDEES